MMDRCQECFHLARFCTCPPEDARLIGELLSGSPARLERIRQIETGMMDLDAAAFEAETAAEDAKAAGLLAEFAARMEALDIDISCRINSREIYWCPIHRRMEERFWCSEHGCYHAGHPQP